MIMLGKDILFAFGKDGKMLMTKYYVMFFYEMYWSMYVLRFNRAIPVSLC